MENSTPAPSIDPRLIRQLVTAGWEAHDYMCDTLNAEWTAGNHEFEDVKCLHEATKRLCDALQDIESAGFASGDLGPTSEKVHSSCSVLRSRGPP